MTHSVDLHSTAARAASLRRRAVALAAPLALAAVTCTGLGVWQLQRRAWKLDLIARVETRVTAPAEVAPGPALWPGINARSAEYRRVVLAGVFRHDRETLVQALTDRGPGYWVMTPLATDAGWTVLVNRGFVPPDRRAPGSRLAGNPGGPASVTGLLRLTEPGGGFLRANDPAAERWYSRDVAAIAAARGLGRTAPYFIDADATPNPGGLPVGGLTVLSFRNTHLVYALTWFALAAMALWAFGFLLREAWRPGGTRPLSS